MGLLADWGAVLLVAGLALVALPGRDPRAPLMRAIGAALTGVLLLRYLGWRVTATLPSPEEGASFALACAFLALELVTGLAALIQLHVLSRVRSRTAEVDAALAGCRGDDALPLIDILIPSYNEAPEILRRTIVGALAQDYPRFRVWVLDDGRRDWLREMATGLGAGYATRADNAHAKAGNMNAGLARILELEEWPEAIAILDADFVATPLFLRRAAAVLLRDPAVALVQTPQYFFNPDPIQLNLRAPSVLTDEQRFLFDVLLPSKDAHGTAFSCGTSGIVRLGPLLEVGGFPTESVTEDFLISLKLKEAGYTTAYLQEPLTAGLAPEGLKEYLGQRGRWCQGTMQIARTRWGPLSAGRVPLRMRLHTLESVIYWSAGSWFRLACIIAPLLHLWLGLTVLRAEPADVLWYAAPCWLATATYLAWVSNGTVMPLFTEAVGLVSSIETSKRSFVGLLGPREQRFRVTAKGASRGHVVVQWGLMRWFVLAIAATLGGLAWHVSEAPGAERGAEGAMLFWSCYNLLALLIACVLCVEQPRFRREERFAADEALTLHGPFGPAEVRLRDISLGGCLVELGGGALPAPGLWLEAEVAGVGRIPCRVARRDGSRLGLAFLAAPATEQALVRKLFSGAYVRPVVSVRMAGLMLGLASSLWPARARAG